MEKLDFKLHSDLILVCSEASFNPWTTPKTMKSKSISVKKIRFTSQMHKNLGNMMSMPESIVISRATNRIIIGLQFKTKKQGLKNQIAVSITEVAYTAWKLQFIKFPCQNLRR